MDDRFDIQFASGEFFDGGGVDYVPNSFHIFGNNGTHTLKTYVIDNAGNPYAPLNGPAIGDLFDSFDFGHQHH